MASNPEEIRVSHAHAITIVRKKRSEQDSLEFQKICAAYGIDFQKTLEIEGVPEVSSAKFKILTIIGQTQTPPGISDLAYGLLLQNHIARCC